MKLHHISIAAVTLLLWSCVEHRPVRNGLSDESTYLTKEELTQPNIKIEGSEDDTWLHRINVVATSAPAVSGEFPGAESFTKLVRFRFREDALQLVDAQRFQPDDLDDPNDDDPFTVDRVLFEFPGKHIDVKLRESLDGERTNWLEENTERGWMDRQSFRVDWEKISLAPHYAMGAIGGYFTSACARVVTTRMVPDSLVWDEADQYLSFDLEVNRVFDLASARAICYAWAFLGQHIYDTNVVDTDTVVYKFQFWRRGETNYEPEYLSEKDPVNKKYGAFQLLNLYVDKQTGLLGGKRLVKRWNPNRAESDPVVYYFAEGFPEKFKDIFTSPDHGIEQATNAAFEAAGATLRVKFLDHDHDGVNRKLGDMRYSFVAWFHNQLGAGPLGYGPSSADPRTGELFSGNVNAYNYAYDLFRFFVAEYLADSITCEVEGENNAELEQACSARPECKWAGEQCQARDLEGDSCEPGTSLAPSVDDDRLDSALFNEMRFVMEKPEETHHTGTAADFLPEPTGANFAEDYHRILPETRYGYPGWNAYTYHTLGKAPVAEIAQMMVKEVEFQEEMEAIMMGDNPFDGTPLHTRAGIESQTEFMHRFREWKKNHQDLKAQMAMVDGLSNIYRMGEGDWLAHLRRSARHCKDDGTWESDSEYSERFLKGIISLLMFHEFGHTIGLRHNFFGSMDKKHFHEGAVSASVMDYVHLESEAGAPARWGNYDINALKWIYGTEQVREEAMQEDFLYCTDEHRIFSPLCRAYDFGTTPAQIVLNAIDQYDWGYKYRNRRAYRQFWDVGSYTRRVFGSVFDIQRMWYLALFDWGSGGVQEVLKRLDQTEGLGAASQAEYDERAVDFYNDLAAANEMMMAFYDAIINQSSSFRNYQTEFDPFYGDIRRIGIIIDKLYATFAFMDLQDVTYSPNISTYVAMYDAPFGTNAFALSQRVLDNMLGSNYDTFPWFRYYAIALFASVTNTNLVGSAELKERIAIHRFNTASDLYERFPQDSVDQALRPDNPQQTFVHDGEEYVYTFLDDRTWHLVAGRSRSPVSFQFLRDYNEALNGNASSGRDNYGLKILLAYHEYYNNFVGY